MITFKRVKECTVDEAVEAYNRGFEGYFFDQSKTADSFVSKMGKEGLSAAHSLVAFIDGEPAGIVLSGIWHSDGKKVAWNGGTGVAARHRRTGVGQALMEETLTIYREQGVELAALVAIEENQRAISLYEKVGFHVVDHSVFFESKGELVPFTVDAETEYQVRHTIPQEVFRLPFWSAPVWNIQWKTIEDKEAMFILDKSADVVGYALYKRIFDEKGELATILLFHCEADPKRADANTIVRYALSNVFSPLAQCIHRLTVNLPASNTMVVSALQEAGFGIMAKQVFMTREMEPGSGI